MTTNHDDLVNARNAEYGEAYQITDRWIKENLEALAASPSPFSLIMIQNKLTRALASPMKQDTYDDIIGYTKLLLRELESINARKEEKERILDSMSDFPSSVLVGGSFSQPIVELLRQPENPRK